MPELGLRLSIGEVDADSIIGPIAGGPTIDGVIQTEAEDFLQVEAGQFLAFD
jgi:hypothetical protein